MIGRRRESWRRRRGVKKLYSQLCLVPAFCRSSVSRGHPNMCSTYIRLYVCCLGAVTSRAAGCKVNLTPLCRSFSTACPIPGVFLNDLSHDQWKPLFIIGKKLSELLFLKKIGSNIFLNLSNCRLIGVIMNIPRHLRVMRYNVIAMYALCYTTWK